MTSVFFEATFLANNPDQSDSAEPTVEIGHAVISGDTEGEAKRTVEAEAERLEAIWVRVDVYPDHPDFLLDPDEGMPEPDQQLDFTPGWGWGHRVG